LTEQEKAAEREIDYHEHTVPRDTEALEQLRKHHAEIHEELKTVSEKLTVAEKIMNGTYVQDMLNNVFDRKRSDMIPNGYYTASSGIRRR